MLIKYLSKKVCYYPNLQWKAKLFSGIISCIFHLMYSPKYKANAHGPFLFIVGCGRSGNTLMRRFLMEYADIYIPPESYVLSKIAMYRYQAQSLSWISFVDLIVSTFEYHPEFYTFDLPNLRDFALEAKNWEKRYQNVSCLIRGLYLWISRKHGLKQSWVGDKTPLNTLNLGLIKKIFPKAKYVYLLRDGVDVSVSYIRAKIYEDIELAADRWLRSQKCWSAFKKKMHSDYYIEIRYEELVKNPYFFVKKIMEAFNIPHRQEKIDVFNFFGDITKKNHHLNVLNPPTSEYIGKGRSSITEQERKILANKLNQTLQRLGYEKI